MLSRPYRIRTCDTLIKSQRVYSNPLDSISTTVLQSAHKLTQGGRNENSGGGC